MGENLSFSVTNENEKILIKNSLITLHKMCFTFLLCGHGPMYGRFMGCTVNETTQLCFLWLLLLCVCFFR